MQLLPDGSADFVSHRPDQLDHGLRWLCQHDQESALGLMLPATAEADGYTAEKAKGNVRLLPPQGEFRCSLEFGALDAGAAEAMRERIEGVMRSATPPAALKRRVARTSVIPAAAGEGERRVTCVGPSTPAFAGMRWRGPD